MDPSFGITSPTRCGLQLLCPHGLIPNYVVGAVHVLLVLQNKHLGIYLQNKVNIEFFLYSRYRWL